MHSMKIVPELSQSSIQWPFQQALKQAKKAWSRDENSFNCSLFKT